MTRADGFPAASFRELRTQQAPICLILFSQLPAVVFYTAQPLLLAALIDDAITPGDRNLAALLLAGMVALLALHAAGDLARHYVGARAGARVMNAMRERVFARLAAGSTSFRGRHRAGDLLARFGSDLDALERFLTDDLPSAFYYVVTILVGVGVLFALEWRLACTVIVLLPLIGIGPVVFARRAAAASHARQRQMGRVVTATEEMLGAHAVVQAFGLQALLGARFRGELERLARRTRAEGLASGLMAASLTCGGYALLALCMATGTHFTLSGDLSVGSFVAILELVWSIVTAVEQIAGVAPAFAHAGAGWWRVKDLLTQPSAVADAPGARMLPPIARAIRFEAVSFAYEQGAPVLRDVSITLPCRRWIAIVGSSGSGKTTLLRLLLRFYDPDAGVVSADGVDLRTVQRRSLRDQIGMVLQDSLLFDATIRENILFGRPCSSDAEIEAAARMAEIHDFIASLPRGYDTRVGERGGVLSGGQRQRIALARALVRKPALLVLDEATSALDFETESAISATLRRLARESIVVSVTHRLAMVAGADLIIALDGGRVVEQGGHGELFARRGLYHRLWQNQPARHRPGPAPSQPLAPAHLVA
jgi:ATP-binding cassette subfamily B protein